jgi:S1-C subfamily serine protease
MSFFGKESTVRRILSLNPVSLLESPFFVVFLLISASPFLFSEPVSGYEAEFIEDLEPIEYTHQPLSSYSTILKKVIPNVVGIYVGSPIHPRINDNLSILEDDNIRSGIGSGLIIDKNGYIVTNSHVLLKDDGNPSEQITVELYNKESFPAEFIAMDKATDLAVIKIDKKFKTSAVLGDSKNLEIGDIVFAIGNPHSIGLTVTMGIVSAKGRTNLGILGYGGYENFIQTDAAINFGNSGGPLVDAEGRTVGINTAIYSKNGGNIGLGFSTPVHLVKSVAYDLITYGMKVRGYIGVLPENITDTIRKSFNIPSKLKGAFIRKVPENLPSHKAGIKVGDIITKINNQPIESAEQLRLVISQMEPGTMVTALILRLNRFITLDLTVSTLGDQPIELRKKSLPHVFIAKLNDKYRNTFKIPKNLEGILVVKKKENASPTNLLQKGMLILEINDRPVKHLKSISQMLKRGNNQLYIWFQGNLQFIRIFVD